MINSLQIAEWIGKSHENVLKDISNEIKEAGLTMFCESENSYQIEHDGVMELAFKNHDYLGLIIKIMHL